MRFLLALGLFGLSSPAWAFKMCLVDFQSTVTETAEGKAAKARIDQLKASRTSELERMRAEFEAASKDLESRSLILSDDARAKEIQALEQQGLAFERARASADAEVQETYYALLGDLDAKMRAIANLVGADEGCGVVLDSAVVVYASNQAEDLTKTLIARFDQAHPATSK